MASSTTPPFASSLAAFTPTRMCRNASSAAVGSTGRSFVQPLSYRVLVDPRDWTSGFISRADVADFLVKQIDDTSLLRQTPVLTG